MSSNTLQNYEQLSYGGPNLAMHRAKAVQVVGDAVATRTLTLKESGGVFQMDSAAGVVYTLPTPVIGATYRFITTTSITSNAAKIITNLATEFLLGEVFAYTTATASGAGFAANGTTIRALSSNGTTTGGLIGDDYTVTAISSTVWFISGVTVGSGTIVTPFAAS